MQIKKPKILKKLTVIFFGAFLGLIILGQSGQNTQHSSGNCQGFYLFGCVTYYNESESSTGYGFPLNDIFIHKTKTINGATTSSYKTVDWHNVYQNLIFNLLAAVILTLPIYLVHKLIRNLMLGYKSRFTKN